MQNETIEIELEHKEGHSLELIDNEELGEISMEIFGQQTVKEFRNLLATKIRSILQNDIQSHPKQNPILAAKAALILSLLLEAFEEFDEKKFIASLDRLELGRAIWGLFGMFTDKEIEGWVYDTTDYYMSMRGELLYGEVAEILGTLTNIKLMVRLIVSHAKANGFGSEN